MAIDIDLNKLDKLIKDHHKKCNQDDVYEYMINKNSRWNYLYLPNYWARFKINLCLSIFINI